MELFPSTLSTQDDNGPLWSWTNITNTTTANASAMNTSTANASAMNTTAAPQRPPISPEDLLVLIMKMFWEYRTSLALGLYGCSLQVGVGTVTNLLTILVMTRRALVSSTTCFYFAFLAVGDLLVLYFSCLRRLLYVVNDHRDLYLRGTWACRAINFMAYFSYDFSSWVLTVMTIDRFIAIRYPLKSAVISTIRNAFFVVLGVIAVCAVKNCHFFFTFEMSQVSPTSRECLGKDAHNLFLDRVWPWVDATFYSFLPFSLLLLFNVLIIYCHRKALRHQRALQASAAVAQGGRMNRFNQRLTIMLLIVSFTFMVMTAPKVILISIRKEVFKFFGEDGRIDFPVIARYNLVSSVFDLLMWTNHSINFFLYCISGTRFRHEFLRMLSQWLGYFRCRCRHSPGSTSKQSGAVRQTSKATNTASSDSQRRGSGISFLSDEVVSDPPRPPVEMEDPQSRVNRWATATFGETPTQ